MVHDREVVRVCAQHHDAQMHVLLPGGMFAFEVGGMGLMCLKWIVEELRGIRKSIGWRG